MSLSTEDRLAITELVAVYNQAIDAGRGEAWADTFTATGVFEVTGRNPVEGRAALIAMVEAQAADSGIRHWTTNFVIDPAGDGATLRCDLTLLRGAEILLTGRYEDELARQDDGWKFTRRRCLPD
ncbi:MAG: hypothetical protein CMQ29_04605 [Gammaproteobacteria bacterium]|jgi:hypothetical protein|nr:hypothetical protein [Gammaproteobacteria bacterium]